MSHNEIFRSTFQKTAKANILILLSFFTSDPHYDRILSNVVPPILSISTNSLSFNYEQKISYAAIFYDVLAITYSKKEIVLKFIVKLQQMYGEIHYFLLIVGEQHEETELFRRRILSLSYNTTSKLK